ncbi:hypothetical protein REPUB_Repub06bG0160900 [Reevesia pubescens]
METQREKLTSAFSWLGDIETKGHTADQVQGSLQTREHYTDTVVKDMEDFENELFAEYNYREVDDSDFQGLTEAIKTTGWDIPDYLKNIASKIENARGPTEFAKKKNPTSRLRCSQRDGKSSSRSTRPNYVVKVENYAQHGQAI